MAHSLTEADLYGLTEQGPRPPVFGSHQPETNGERWLWSLIRSRVRVIVDVGVREQLTYPDDGRVIQHCFEPNPAFCQQLRLAANEHIFINPYGLGRTEGTVTYYRHSESIKPRAHYQCLVTCSCRTSVPIRTLDAYCQEKGLVSVDFLKLDVEGYELAVLQGATQILPAIGAVQFEYGGTYADNNITLTQIYECLAQAGLTYVYLICPNYLCRMVTPFENGAYANYLATHVPALDWLNALEGNGSR